MCVSSRLIFGEKDVGCNYFRGWFLAFSRLIFRFCAADIGGWFSDYARLTSGFCTVLCECMYAVRFVSVCVCLSAADLQLSCIRQTHAQRFIYLSFQRSGEHVSASLWYKVWGPYGRVWMCPRLISSFCAADLLCRPPAFCAKPMMGTGRRRDRHIMLLIYAILITQRSGWLVRIKL